MRAIVLTLLATIALAGCGDTGSSTPLPRYFAFDGTQKFVASRNLTGRTIEEIDGLLDKARDEGTTLVRFHVTHAFGPAMDRSGAVDEAWAASWDAVFERAAEDGIQVMPVFGVWADWNDGTPDYGWKAWAQNPLNAANGGPGDSPASLYRSGSAAQKAWLGWLRAVTTRWQAHPNVAAWEVFSELDLLSHPLDLSFEGDARRFVEAGAAVIRAADPLRRPVTASLAAWNRWSNLYWSGAIDLLQIHYYGQNLDDFLLDAAPQLRQYGKPLLLGESGLDARAPDGTTATTAADGPRETRHAVWAALVSGFVNGRALWWEDGYAILQNGDPGVPFVTGYPAVEHGVLGFLGGRDLGAMKPLSVDAGGWLRGAAIGDGQTVLGWVRDAYCGFQPWGDPQPCSPQLGRSAAVVAPGAASTWQATFHDPATGAAVGASITVSRTGNRVVIPLPDFADDLAFELVAEP
jgi:hypothetical protein